MGDGMDLLAPECGSVFRWLALGAGLAGLCLVLGAAWGWQLRVTYELDLQ